MRSKRLYLFVAHGSRETAAQDGFESLLKILANSLKPHAVSGAYLTLNQPSVAEAVETAVQQGVDDFVVAPLFFFEGTHIQKDIPQILADLKLKYPMIDFQTLPAVASLAGFADWVAASAAQSTARKVK